MRVFLPLSFVVFTSVGAYLYGKKVLRLPNRELSAAWKTLLECVWLSVIFFAFNLLVAFTGILAWRVAVGSFISFYIVSDVTLLIFSLLQGIIFYLWRREMAHIERHSCPN